MAWIIDSDVGVTHSEQDYMHGTLKAGDVVVMARAAGLSERDAAIIAAARAWGEAKRAAMDALAGCATYGACDCGEFAAKANRALIAMFALTDPALDVDR